MQALWASALCTAMAWSGAAEAAVYAVNLTNPGGSFDGRINRNLQITTNLVQPITLFPGDELFADVSYEHPLFLSNFMQGITAAFPEDDAAQLSTWINGSRAHDSAFTETFFITFYQGPLSSGAFTVREVGFEVTGIPEPTTWAMVLLGFVGLGFMARGQCKSQCYSHSRH